MRIITLILAVMGIVLTSCSSGANDSITVEGDEIPSGTEEINFSTMSAREMVEKNVFIDIDTQEAAKMSSVEATNHEKPSFESNALRAALYRIYSRITVENRQYVCSAKTAKDVNLSESTFNSLMEGIESFNKSVKADDDDFVPEAPSKEYLESLIAF